MAVQVSGSRTQELMAKRDAYVARGVALAPIVASRAHGARLVDADGKEYIDFAGGIGVLNLGHTPDAVVEAIKTQAEALLHSCFPVAAYEPYLDVSQMLCELTPGTHAKKAVLVNSGAEAVENAVKIARYATGRDGVITFDRGFHGRTLLTMALTSKLVYKKGMGPFAPEVYRAPAPYPYRGVSAQDALDGLDFIFKAHVDPASVACVILEPVQGEGGFTVMPPEFIQGLKQRCEQHGILYIDDEVQAGMGRTGTLLGIEHSGVVPDLVTVGKSLASGMPLAGVIGAAEVMDRCTWAAWARPTAATRWPARPRSRASRRSPTRVPGPQRRGRRAHPGPAASDGGAHPRDRRGARHRPDVRDRAGQGPRTPGARGRADRGDGGRCPGARAAAAEDRHLRQRFALLVPITATDEDLDTGLERLEESLVAAASG